MIRIVFTRGFTIIELMITLVLAAILISLAIPAFKSTVERRRLEGATSTLFEDLNFAKSESIKQNQGIYVQFNKSAWCYGMDDTPAPPAVTDCDCNAVTTNCSINNVEKVVKSTDYPNITLSATGYTGTAFSFFFDPTRGTASDAGTLTLTSSLVGSKSVSVSLLGRIKMD